jgi:hypothetical protein
MAYTETNYKTKKALLADLRDGVRIHVYQPGPFGPGLTDGRCTLEGPHYPEPHRWYASAQVKDGVLVSAK